MPTIHFNQTTTLSSEEFVAGALKTVGRGVLDTAFVGSIKAIEAQHNGVPAG